MSSDQPERKMVGSPSADSGIDPIVEPYRTRAPTYHRIGTRPIDGRRRRGCTLRRTLWRGVRLARSVVRTAAQRVGSEATRRVGLDDPLDGPGDKQPPGDAAGDAPEPRDAHGDIVALCFVPHVRRSCTRFETPPFDRTEFPLADICVPEENEGETRIRGPFA